MHAFRVSFVDMPHASFRRRVPGIETYIDLHSITFRCATHVALGEKTIWEEGEKDELGKRQQLVPRQNEAYAPAL